MGQNQGIFPDALVLAPRAHILDFRSSAALAAATILARYWAALDAYLSGLEKSVVQALTIGIGAAITGIIAIAFSLSLFAIQQVADKGTPATVEAYARDKVLALIYWALTRSPSGQWSGKADSSLRSE